MKLCYRCFEKNHFRQPYTRGRLCGLRGYKETDNKLLRQSDNKNKNCLSAVMHAHKWLCKNMLQIVPKEDKAKEVDLHKDELPSVKTLGVMDSRKRCTYL